MSELNSPYFDHGCDDGTADSVLASSCPPGMPQGPDPGCSWSVMYMRGYSRTYNPQPCPCDGSCKRGRMYGEAPDNDDNNGSGYVDYWYSGDMITL